MALSMAVGAFTMRFGRCEPSRRCGMETWPSPRCSSNMNRDVVVCTSFRSIVFQAGALIGLRGRRFMSMNVAQVRYEPSF